MNTVIKIAVVVLILLVIFSLVTFRLNETQQAIILQFGKPVGMENTAGLHFKLPPPFHTIEYFEKRLLIYDTPPNIVVTQDKKNMVVDSYARWSITDPLLFRQTVRTEPAAQARLDDIIYSDLLKELGRHTLEEIVNTNRDTIMINVALGANEKAVAYGIAILDVRIKRTDLPKENEEAIYRRMRAERNRIANLYRGAGDREARTIRAGADKDVKAILAEAYKTSQIKRGEAESKAIDIYARAFNQDPNFFEFMRTMEMYKKTLDGNTTIVLPPDNELFKYLR